MSHRNDAVLHFTGVGGRTVAVNGSLLSFCVLNEPTADEVCAAIEAASFADAASYWDQATAHSLFALAKQTTDRLSAFGLGSGTSNRYRNSVFRRDALFSACRNHAAGCPATVEGIHEWIETQSMDTQRSVLDALRPASFADLERVFAPLFYYGRRRRDLKRLLDQSGSVREFLDECFRVFVEGGSPKGSPFTDNYRNAQQIAELLTVMHENRWILFPLWHVSSKAAGTQRWEPLCSREFAPTAANHWGEVMPLLPKVYGQVYSSRLKLLFSGTTLETTEDCSFEFFQHIYAQVLAAPRKTSNYPSADVIQSWATAVSLLLQGRGKQMRADLTKRVSRNPSHRLRKDVQFRWVLDHGNHWKDWQQVLAKYLSRKQTISTPGYVQGLNAWLDYLLTLQDPPLDPWAVVRPDHIHNFTDTNHPTFLNWLRARRHSVSGKPLNVAAINQPLGVLNGFFEDYEAQLQFARDPRAADWRNPIVISEDFVSTTSSRSNSTHRPAMPAPLMALCKRIVKDNDYAWSREQEEDWAQVLDSETGKIVRIWSPVRAVMLEVALTVPIRIKNLRWLDTGEGDDSLPVRTETGEINQVPNVEKRGIETGRSECVLRIVRDKVTGQRFMGLWISTNKTPKDGEHWHGYEVAWLPDDLEQSVRMMIAWQRRYNPIDRPTRWDDDVVDKVSPALREQTPCFWPVFRDPTAKNMAERAIPLSHARIGQFFLRVLARAQATLATEYGTRVSLVRRDVTKSEPRGRMVSDYDLHSLRVAGITAFVEAGIPINIIADFISGHASYVMALRYVSIGPSKVRDILQKHFMDSSGELDAGELDFIREHMADMEPFVVTGSKADGTDALAIFRQFSGGELVDWRGICPVGRNCAVGGPKAHTESRAVMVEGGPGCCAHCRFWLTGPMFLPGLTHYANTTWLESRSAANAVLRLKNDRIIADHADQKRKVLSIDREIAMAEARFHAKVSEWFAILPVIQKSAELLDAFLAKKHALSGLPLVSSGSKTDVLASAKQSVTADCFQTNAFTLLHHINQFAEFHPSAEVTAARFEMKDMLDRILDDDFFHQALLHLDADTALRTMNRLSEFVVESIRPQDVDAMIAGKLTLTEATGSELLIDHLHSLKASLASHIDMQPLLPGRVVSAS